MKDGEQLIPCEYDSISSWWEYGPSAHYVVKDKKVGIIDYIGKVLLPTEYDSLDYVTKDVVIVTKDSKYGAVDINNSEREKRTIEQANKAIDAIFEQRTKLREQAKNENKYKARKATSEYNDSNAPKK